jgi:hypothetical protein
MTAADLPYRSPSPANHAGAVSADLPALPGWYAGLHVRHDLRAVEQGLASPTMADAEHIGETEGPAGMTQCLARLAAGP